MSRDTDPTTKQELEVALDTLVMNAYENGVQVADRGYQLQHDDPEIPDWGVEIIRIGDG